MQKPVPCAYRWMTAAPWKYSGIAEALWHRLQSSGSQWSFYRDNIEEEFTARRVSASASGGKNPLDGLFKL